MRDFHNARHYFGVHRVVRDCSPKGDLFGQLFFGRGESVPKINVTVLVNPSVLAWVKHQGIFPVSGFGQVYYDALASVIARLGYEDPKMIFCCPGWAPDDRVTGSHLTRGGSPATQPWHC